MARSPRHLTRRSSLLIAGLLALSSALSGCGEEGPTGPATGGDDDAPLSNYAAIFEGAPANGTLPNDNKADAVYPTSYDELTAFQSPVRSQGSRGVCSIFATVGLMEHLYIKAGLANPDFSEQHLQWSAKVEAKEFTYTEGSSASANLKAINRFGIVDEATWPYESAPWDSINDPACGPEEGEPVQCYTNGDPSDTVKAGKRYKLAPGRFVNTNSIKAHLFAKKTAVVIGLDFFYQSWNHRKSILPRSLEYWDQGYVLYPNAEDRTESLKKRAGHAILIVGWDDNLEVPIVDKDGKPVLGPDGQPKKEKGFYIFKNSWGTTGFGIKNRYGAGYGYLSYRYAHEEGTVYTSEVPKLDAPTPPPPPPGTVAETFPLTVDQTIPDNSPAGLQSEINVASTGAVQTVTVSVDIAHSYVGDLTLKLVHGAKTVTLQQKQGGPEDNLVKSFTVSDFAGLDRNGSWRLEVVDSAREDEGTLRTWTLELK